MDMASQITELRNCLGHWRCPGSILSRTRMMSDACSADQTCHRPLGRVVKTPVQHMNSRSGLESAVLEEGNLL